MQNKLRPKPWILAMLLLPGLIIFSICCVTPLVVAGYYSLFNWDGGITKTFIGLANYGEMIGDVDFWAAFLNNVEFMVYSVVGQIGLAIVVAMLMISKIVKCKHFHRTIIFFPVILSGVVVAYLWEIIYNRNYGLLNGMLTFIGREDWILPWLDDANIIIRTLAAPKIWQWIGYYMLILLAAIHSIDPSILECAELDGATGWRKSVYIILPMIKNTLIVTIILCVSGNMKTFDQIYAMTGGGPGTSSMVLALYAYKMAFVRMRYGYGNACAIGIMILSLAMVGISKLAGGKKSYDE